MKKLGFIFLSLFASSAYSQSEPAQLSQVVSSSLYRNKVTEGEQPNYLLEGSPYILKDYVNGEIAGIPLELKVRYNALRDEVEILKNNEAFVISKIPEYSTIKLADTYETIKLVNYTDKTGEKSGYLFELQSTPNVTLYKKEEVILTKEKLAKTSYDTAIPARYETQPVRFFIQQNGGPIVAMPTSKKKFIEMFPAKESAINDYFKRTSVDFKDSRSIANFVKIL